MVFVAGPLRIGSLVLYRIAIEMQMDDSGVCIFINPCPRLVSLRFWQRGVEQPCDLLLVGNSFNFVRFPDENDTLTNLFTSGRNPE